MSSFREVQRAIGMLGTGLFLDVAVRYLGGEAALLEGFFDLLGEHDGAVFPAGATEGDRQIALALANVMRNEVGQKALNAAEKLASLRKRTDVFLDFGILACV